LLSIVGKNFSSEENAWLGFVVLLADGSHGFKSCPRGGAWNGRFLGSRVDEARPETFAITRKQASHDPKREVRANASQKAKLAGKQFSKPL